MEAMVACISACSTSQLLWLRAKVKSPLSGISGLPHKTFFRPHGRSSVLCGPGKIPCLYLAWTVLLTHHTTVSTQGWKTKSTSGNHGNLVQCTVVPQSAPSRRASNEGSRFMDGGKVAMHFSWAEY